MKQFFGSAAGVALLIVIFVGLIFGGGYIGLRYKHTFETASKDVDREIFKETSTYNEGVLDDLAKYRYEMIQAEDDTERAAIAELVNSRFANYDQSKIENKDLKDFLEECRDGTYTVKEAE